MVAAMVERDTPTLTATGATIVLDYYCPTCRRGYLGSIRFTVGAEPVAGREQKRGYCNPCHKWRWVDAASGVPRTDGESGQR